MALAAAVALSPIAAALPASGAVPAPTHPPGAVKLPARELKRVGGFVCGNAGGHWMSGALTSAGWFLSDLQQARDSATVAAHARGDAKAADLRRAAVYTARAKTRTPRCASPVSPARVAGSGAIRVSPQFFGQHLMFNWALNPAVPVRAMRLWDSNTEWCEIQPRSGPGQFDWGQLDALLGQAARVSADVEFTFGHTPQWAAHPASASPAGSDKCAGSSGNAPPANESYWTNFVTALVTHAQGKIHAYELWNEADYSVFWAGGVASLVKMSIDAAAIIHRIDPSALVLSPSTTATPEGYAFLHEYLSRLPPGTIDAIAVHSYTNGAWPETAVPAQMRAVRAALPSAYAKTPIWSTEGGWGQSGQFPTSSVDRRAFVARYDLEMLMHGVVRSYWYAYQNTAWGTLWNGTALTAAGTATATVNAWLAGATLTGCATADGNLWTCNLTTVTGRRARIVWVTRTPVVSYSTAGYATVSRLDGQVSPTHGSRLAVTIEPILLSA